MTAADSTTRGRVNNENDCGLSGIPVIEPVGASVMLGTGAIRVCIKSYKTTA